MPLFRRNDRSVRVTVSGATDVGRNREHNEDRFLVADLTSKDASLGPGTNEYTLGPKGSLLLVADGMGGALGGEVASQMAADLIYEQLATKWWADEDHSPAQFASRVREAVEEANAHIHARSSSQPELHGMGTTATIVGIIGQHFLLSQVGDSRAYLIRNGSAVQLTRDQSFVQHLVDTGRVTAEQASQLGPQNVILQALGPAPAVEVVQGWQEIMRGDTVLLCSDGLSGLVTAEEIAEAVAGESKLSRACQSLIDLANERGGPDNITVVVARLTGDGLLGPDEVEAVDGTR